MYESIVGIFILHTVKNIKITPSRQYNRINKTI